MTIHHLNCGYLQKGSNTRVICHCLLLEDDNGALALVDTGIGLLDIARPYDRIGHMLIDQAGFQFNEADTAIQQLERLGFEPSNVRHCIISHMDPDHIGGLSDFPLALVHVSAVEYNAFITTSSARYRPQQLSYQPKLCLYSFFNEEVLGLPGARVRIGFSDEIYLVPLAGHTLGHCGIAIRQPPGWTLYVGDAYYLRMELKTDDHRISELVRGNAIDNEARILSLSQLRRIQHEYGDSVQLFGYHDPSEWPEGHLSRTQ